VYIRRRTLVDPAVFQEPLAKVSVVTVCVLWALLRFQAEAIMPGFELEAEVVCPADAKTKAMETVLDLVLSRNKPSRALDAAKRGLSSV
jgi:hypothetical protein